MSDAHPVLALLTDFGAGSGYVAQMKTLALEQLPGLRIVDVSHSIPPQDLHEAAWLVYAYAQGLPRRERTVLAVVDPGVGTERRVIIVRAMEQTFVAPDNGLLSYVLEADRGAEVRELPPAPPGASCTFHGRDHFLPLVLDLLEGRLDPKGCPIREAHRPPGLVFHPAVRGEGYAGSVLHVDRFGNLITSLRGEHYLAVSRGSNPALIDFDPAGRGGPLKGSEAGAAPPAAGVRFLLDGAELPYRLCYADCPAGTAAVLLGSSGHFEIAVRNASARESFGGAIRLDMLPGDPGIECKAP